MKRFLCWLLGHKWREKEGADRYGHYVECDRCERFL